MNEPVDNGGNAFPGPSFARNGIPNGHDMGMSLRDWFAGQALAGMCGHPRALSQVSDRDLAEDAKLLYRIADAMIAARKGGAK